MPQDQRRQAASVWQHHPIQDNPLQQLPALYEAALDEFSQKSFAEASLNDIIKRAGTSKGSFYYRFQDKMALYLSLLDLITRQKLAHFSAKSLNEDFPSDFFAQIKLLARAGMEFALKEPRVWAVGRQFMAESEQLKQQVKQAFPDRGKDALRRLVEAGAASGQFRDCFPVEFIFAVVNLLLNNFDALIWPQMTEDQLLQQVDRLAELLQHGFAG
jgi:TetR/AcrR family transcriptional regulator